MTISFGDSLHGIVAGYSGLLYTTSDGGNSWVDRSLNGYTVTGIHMVDANRVIGVANHYTGNYILISTDGGSSWKYQLSPVQQSLKELSFSSPTLGYVVGVNGTVLKTTDGGESWSPQTLGYVSTLLGIHTLDSLYAFAVSNEGKIYRTTNGGTSWNRYVIVELTSPLHSIYFTDRNNGITVGWAGSIYRTTDGGNSWVKQQSNSTQELLGVMFSDPLRGVACGRGTILITTDGGSIWNPVNPESDDYQQVALQGSQDMTMVGYNGIVLRTSLINCSFTTYPVSPLTNTPGVPLVYLQSARASVTVSWYIAPFLNTDSYIIQFSQDSTFTSGTREVIKQLIPSTNIYSQIFSELSGNTTYYWRVALLYFNSTRTGWSNTSNFKTAGGSISGIVYKDFNKDSALTGDELGIYNQHIFMTGNHTGEFVTDSSGKFLFEGQDAGVYNLRCTPSAPWKITTRTDNFTFNLSTNEIISAINFGQYYPWNSISGIVFHDMNENGIKDEGETGVEGWEVKLKTFSNADTSLTEMTGLYRFPGLTTEQCSVFVIPPQNWEMFVPRLVEGYDVNFGGIDKHYSNVHFAVHPIPQRIKIPITYHDNGSFTFTTIRWGVRPGASAGIWNADISATHADFAEGEEDLPPHIPNGYDVRFIRPSGIFSSFGNGSWVDMRPFYSPSQIDTYKIAFSTGYFSNGSYPVTFTWSKETVQSSYAGAVTLTDPDGNITDMKLLNSLVITDSLIESLRLIAASPLLPPLDIRNEINSTPVSFFLEQNYPNPFNPSTVIRYSLPATSYVTLKIYDLLGREIATLVNETEDAGYKTREWDASNLPGGVYFYELNAQQENHPIVSLIKKLVLIK